ncbi:MAG: hypothetical protein U0359_08850 [Byssovorax sp.]
MDQLGLGVRCGGIALAVLVSAACDGGGTAGAGGGSQTTTSSTTGDGGSSGSGGSSTSASGGGGQGGMPGTGGAGGMGGGSAAGGGGGIPETCGDGKLDLGEECDEGDKNANTGACTLACKHAKCGDGFVESGAEECDEGAQNSNAGTCTLACKVAVCGDGLKAPGEGCDDGNATDADGCNTTCLVSGSALWTKSYNGAAGGNDLWNGVAVDAAGNIVVTGSEAVAGQGLNIITRKLDPQGNTLWTQTYAGVVPGGDDEGNGVAVDGAGNVAVIGYETTAMQAKNIWLRKYAPNGAVLWTLSINGSPAVNFDDIGYAVTFNAAGDLCIAASATFKAGQGRDTVVAKMRGTDGTFVWLDAYNGPVSQDDEARAVAVDPQGDVIAAGVTRGPTSFDVWVRKIHDLGMTDAIAWTKTYDGAASGLDAAFGVAVDAQGNPVVAGAESVAGQSLNLWVRKYDGVQGNTLWTQGYNGAAGKNDIGESVAIDPGGDVVVAGFESLADLSTDLLVRKLDASGNLRWSQTYDGPSHSNDTAGAVAILPGKDIAVAGYENVVGQNANAIVSRRAP